MAAGSHQGILLVEDDEGDALLVRECLREAGTTEDQISWCRTLQEGIEALAEHPSCVLLDLGLPDAHGLDGLHRLVAAQSAVPIVVLTGRNDRTGVDAVAAGAQDYLIKDDITPDLLDRTIRYAVQRRQAQLTELQLRQERILAAENARLERGLLPRPLLRSSFVSCASLYQPGRARAVIGGDFFDVVETPDQTIRAVIGDVMGHGPDEAALGVNLRVAWRALVLAGVPDDQVLVTLARVLEAESGGEIFVTVCDLTLRRDLSAELRLAGHPPPLVCSAGEVRYLDLDVGPPLGVQAGEAESGGHRTTRTRFEPGSSLVFYTDGLLEVHRNTERRDSIGLDELRAAVGSAWACDAPVEAFIKAVVHQAPTRAADDTALVVLTIGDPDQ